MTHEKNHYFAAANTTGGFVSYYDDIFGKLERIHVIKGGSGTGKSRLMKEVATEAEKNGATVEYFHCSFDPKSLDGIIINNTTAVIDGTPPHVYEPRLPGAMDSIIDLGQFWNSDELAEQKDTLTHLYEEKRTRFNLAYKYLSCYGDLVCANRLISQKYLIRDKINSVVTSVGAHHSPCGAHFAVRLSSSFGMNGTVEFSSYKDAADEVVMISDEKGTFLTSEIIGAFPNGQIKMQSFSPCEVKCKNAILLFNGTAVVSEQSNGDFDVSEFLTADIGSYADTLAENAHLADIMLKHAEDQLKKAAFIHRSIEEIYISAMDFERKESYTADLVKKIKY